MKQASLVRAFRLPLLVALAFNVAAVLVLPLYRTRLAADLAESPAKTADAFDSLPVSLPPSGDTSQQTADSLQSSSSEAGATQAQAALTDTAGLKDLEPIADEDRQPDAHPDMEPMPGDVGLDESAVELATAKPLAAVGETLAQLNRRSSTLSRPVAQAAGRLTRWLAHADASAADSAAFTADATAASPTESAPETSEPTAPEAAEPPRIVIRNRLKNGYPVAFLIDERVESLAPGKEFAITAAKATVRFDQGRSYGEAREDLIPGLYHFMITPEGWKLHRQDRSDGSTSQPSQP